MRCLLPGSLVLAVVCGCAPALESPAQEAERVARESAAVKGIVDSLNAAYFQGSADMLIAQYAEDAEIVAGPMELKGHAAIRGWMMGGASMNGTMRMRAVSIAANGPLAIERGVYTMTFTPPGAPSALSEDGNYLIHWRLVDGHWLRTAQFASSPRPVQFTPPPPE
jgi:hypothetical protein